MRIRQSFGRQESADSRKPLINDDTDASTFSLASQQTTGDQQSSSSNDATLASRNSSSVSKLSRPMAVIHINDNDPVDGRPKKPPAMPTQKAPKSQIKRKSSAPDSSIHNEKPSESQVSSSNKKCSGVQNNTQSSSSRRTASLRDANLPEERLRLKRNLFFY
ncbi:hypothetical protein M3Y97_00030800 [Aphelenchoides bicaudatus]|nr:hypothetical protein M3Y97_00030800 [Aphelenchoides bicaudatus]